MDPVFFESVIQQVAPLTRSVALHLMGDPLVHPRLEAFIEVCEKYQVPVFLVTNGVLLREKEAALLLHPIFQQVNFSLHSFADNFGDKDPSVYLDRIFQFTRMAFEKRPDLYINYRLWNLTADRGRLAEHRTVVQKIEAEYGVCIPEHRSRDSKSLRLINRLYMHFDTEFIWPNLELPEIGTEGTCQGLTSHIGVLADGTVVPCCLDKEGVIALGNLKTQSLSAILSSAKAQAMLAGFRSGILVEELCRKCQYIERFAKKKSVDSRPLVNPQTEAQRLGMV